LLEERDDTLGDDLSKLRVIHGTNRNVGKERGGLCILVGEERGKLKIIWKEWVFQLTFSRNRLQMEFKKKGWKKRSRAKSGRKRHSYHDNEMGGTNCGGSSFQKFDTVSGV